MDEAVNLEFWIKLSRKYWLLVVACTLIGIVIAALLTFKIMKPQYQSSVQILVSRRSDNAAAQYANQQADVQMITTYKELITNQVILNPVRKHLKEKYGENATIEKLQKAISVANTQNSQVFSVKVTDQNSSRSANIANQIAQDFKAQVKGIIKVNNVTIVSPATPPIAPVSPRKVVNMLLGLAVGAMFGVGVAVIRTLTDRRVQGSDYLTDELGLVVLGQVNHQQPLREHELVEQLKRVKGRFDKYSAGNSENITARKRV